MLVVVLLAYWGGLLAVFMANFGFNTIGWASEFRKNEVRLKNVRWEALRDFLARERNEDAVSLTMLKLKVMRLVQFSFVLMLAWILITSWVIFYNKSYETISLNDWITAAEGGSMVPIMITLHASGFVAFIIIAFWLRFYRERLRIIHNDLQAISK
jgi:hypothetical protein